MRCKGYNMMCDYKSKYNICKVENTECRYIDKEKDTFELMNNDIEVKQLLERYNTMKDSF